MSEESLLLWDLIYLAKSFYANLLILFQLAKWSHSCISWRDGHLVYRISFLKVLPPSCMTSASHAWHIQSSGSSLTIFSPMRCIFTARFQSIVELCPQTFLFYKLFVQGRVIGHKQQKSILSTKADGRSNGRDLLVYEWQGKPECQVRRQGSREPGQLRAWPDLCPGTQDPQHCSRPCWPQRPTHHHPTGLWPWHHFSCK